MINRFHFIEGTKLFEAQCFYFLPCFIHNQLSWHDLSFLTKTTAMMHTTNSVTGKVIQIPVRCNMTASSGCSRKAGESSSDWKRTVTSALPFTTSMMVLAISEACRSPAMVEPFSEEYNTHAAFKKIPLDALKKLPSPMNLICVTPTRIDALFSDFKKDGYSVRQVLHQLAWTVSSS